MLGGGALGAGDVFGAVEGVRRPGPDGRAQHAMLLFGPAMLMIETENPEAPARPPNPDGHHRFES